MKHNFTINDEIQKMKWSPDDNFILTFNKKKNVIHIRTLNSEIIEMQLEGWSGCIQDEMLAGVTWSSDSRQIITFSDLQLRATVWSLVEQAPVAYLKSPKLLPPKGFDTSSNGKFVCIAERRECKDWVSIYYAGHDWKLVNSFET